MDPPARANLSGLPNEIKSRIAGLLSIADQRREEAVDRQESLRPRPAQGQPPLPKLKRRPKDCDHLSKVSRGWNALCSAHLFRNLRVSKTRDTTFKFRTLGRHGHKFRVLHFDVGSHENPDTILITLALLSSVLANVTELAFTGASIRLLDRALPPSEWEAAFAVAATQVTKLKVTEAQPDQVITLFHHLPSLCNVHLRGDSLFADSDVASLPASAMLDVLAGMSLDHLKLEPSCVGRQMAERSLGGIVGDRSWASALRSLDVTLPSFDTQGWAFITSFAPSLESLNVKCSGNILDGPPPAPIFPRLTHLTVAGSAASVAVILALFSKSPIQQVDVTLMGIPFDHLRLPLQLLPVQLQPFERLRHVIVDSYPTVGPAYSIENLAITLQRRSVTLETPFPSTKTLQDYPESLEVRRHVVRVTLREVHGVLNATRRLMLRMSDNGEVEKLHEVLRATQGIVALKREEDY